MINTSKYQFNKIYKLMINGKYLIILVKMNIKKCKNLDKISKILKNY